ncbi:phosphoglycerate mutase family protein [Prosthecochloris sp. SCSIO W1101]|uniref:phosphoglycerate mutase family protein n=1 Tax=Prosthecochloris sp. SCSIO W1101 TaxID=2992242 RepID=UPI00223D87BE|nr:phosphoglycerate mutase family protein [Prosthecochloris sp. SCSIO W1101]UZJ40235.1 phosphoglycerate mutase family protein [Prosthecochloris sp. SCSIO W1101]
MEDILETAKQIEEEAWSVIDETGVINHWSSIGATINLVGSLKTGLLINNRDIDFHIYTNPFNLSDSFLAISRLAENKRIKTVSYSNLLDAEDKCIEWHAFYDDQNGNSWQIDMIHILNESPYAGYFERVAECISKVLTKETREAILRIKKAIPTDKKVMSVQIYKAVIEDGVRNLEAFWQWEKQNRNEGIVTWVP